MKISCNHIGKQFGYQWIFRGLSYEFSSGQIYGIKGSNGSGKSTFIKILAGFTTPSEGTIIYQDQNIISNEKIRTFVGLSGPYIDLIDEMTVQEFFHFQHQLKPIENYEAIILELKALPFKKLLDKNIGQLSSGMRQRILLLMAVGSANKILFLDEPSSNLDAEGMNWWPKIVQHYAKGKLVFIASNDLYDLSHCQYFIDMEEFRFVKSNQKQINF